MSNTSRRTFRKFSYRGVDLSTLLTMPLLKFASLLPSKRRRHILRGLHLREVDLIKECLKAKEECVNPGEKPRLVATNARSMIIIPQFVDNLIGVHNGMVYVPLEIKPEMIGYRLQDYVPTKNDGGHGKPGAGATASSKFIPLK